MYPWGTQGNGGRDSLLSCTLSAGHLVSVAFEDVSCVCSAMYPCVVHLVSCVFGPCPAKSLCTCGVLLCGHRPLVVCTYSYHCESVSRRRMLLISRFIYLVVYLS